MNEQSLRSYGLSLILVALMVGGLGRMLHVADAIKMTLSVVSILLSFAALVLFVKGAPASRRPFILALAGAAIVVAVLTMFLLLHR